MKRQWKFTILLGFILIIGSLFVPAAAAQTSTAGSLTWVGVFFASPTIGSGTSATATFTGLNRTWPGVPTDGAGNALPGMPADNWSARFSTTATFTTGFWEFQVLADDGVRVLVNGNPVIDALSANGTNSHCALVNLTAGSFNVVVELVDRSGTGLIQVNWFASSSTSTCGSGGATPTPQVIANVVTVRGLAVRTGPFLGASMVAVARPNVEYPVLARNTQEGLFTWYLIQYDEDTQGWSSGRYLSFPIGDPTTVELRNSTHFDDVDDPRGTVLAFTRSVMNFRVRPSPRVARVPEVPQLFWGAQVEVLARTVQGGLDFWYQVRYSPEGTDASYVGWIIVRQPPDWLWVVTCCSGDPIDSVPIK